MRNSQKGEIITVLTIGAFLLISLVTVATSLFSNKHPQTTKTQASSPNCSTYPVIPPEDGGTPNGYFWQADCNHICAATPECPKNTSEPQVFPDTSNWCYGFGNGARCMMLHYGVRPTEGPSTPTPTTQPQATLPPNQGTPTPASNCIDGAGNRRGPGESYCKGDNNYYYCQPSDNQERMEQNCVAQNAHCGLNPQGNIACLPNPTNQPPPPTTQPLPPVGGQPPPGNQSCSERFDGSQGRGCTACIQRGTGCAWAGPSVGGTCVSAADNSETTKRPYCDQYHEWHFWSCGTDTRDSCSPASTGTCRNGAITYPGCLQTSAGHYAYCSSYGASPVGDYSSRDACNQSSSASCTTNGPFSFPGCIPTASNHFTYCSSRGATPVGDYTSQSACTSAQTSSSCDIMGPINFPGCAQLSTGHFAYCASRQATPDGDYSSQSACTSAHSTLSCDITGPINLPGCAQLSAGHFAYCASRQATPEGDYSSQSACTDAHPPDNSVDFSRKGDLQITVPNLTYPIHANVDEINKHLRAQLKRDLVLDHEKCSYGVTDGSFWQTQPYNQNDHSFNFVNLEYFSTTENGHPAKACPNHYYLELKYYGSGGYQGNDLNLMKTYFDANHKFEITPFKTNSPTEETQNLPDTIDLNNYIHEAIIEVSNTTYPSVSIDQLKLYNRTYDAFWVANKDLLSSPVVINKGESTVQYGVVYDWVDQIAMVKINATLNDFDGNHSYEHFFPADLNSYSNNIFTIEINF